MILLSRARFFDGSINLFLVLLDVILEEEVTLVLFAPCGHNHTAAADNLAGVAFLIDLAETAPLAELLVVVDLNKQKKRIKKFIPYF